MKTIAEIIDNTRTPDQIIEDLKLKSITVPGWSDLEKEYNPKKHPVMTDPSYTDKTIKGKIEKVTRITMDLQRLAVKRMTELAFGIPVKRTYTAETDGEKEVAKVMEKIFTKNRIDALNIERGNMLFAGCEVVTLWYAVEKPNNYYGVKSPIKLRCKNYSPMNGDTLWPLFDEYDDLTALSFGYSRTNGNITTEYFDTYTQDTHIQWTREANAWVETAREPIALGKIPAIYLTRPTPIWEDNNNNVYEMEWTLSRNGNYLRKNSKPLVGVFSDQKLGFGGEKSDDDRSVFQYPTGSDVRYITWAQAIESLKFHIQTLKQEYFSSLQLPDMSYENMKSTPMSGEARKMMFIDCQLKVTDESGRWMEAFDREVNVIREFMKIIMPKSAADIDSLGVEILITPYSVNDDKDTIANLTTATGGKAIMSQRQAVKYLGWAEDVDEEMKALQDEAMADIAAPTM